MNVLRRIAMAMGGTVVVALVIGLAAPKTVRAVVSTLVTVANTSANPVPTQAMDNPALQHFEVSANCSTVVSCANDTVILNVPVGMTAVVQDVSADCQVAVPDVLILSLRGSDATNPLSVVEGTVELTPTQLTQNASGANRFAYGRQATLYAGSTSTGPQGQFTFKILGLPNFVFCTANISGYYVKNGL
jgi:hypothetical protein